MKPKKKSKVDYILYAVGFFAAVWLSMHLACCISETTAGWTELDGTGAWFQDALTAFFSTRLLTAPYRCALTGGFLLYALLIWFAIVALSEVKKRNYIRGKEYGTARWGTQKDIEDLFAENICREDIKRAKAVGSKRGRKKAKKAVYRDCEKDGKALLASKMAALSASEARAKACGTYDRRRHKEDAEAVRAEVEESVERAKRAAWEPDRLEDAYRKRLEEIEADALYTEKDREEQRGLAASDRDAALADFYSSAGRTEKVRLKYADADMPLTKTERICIYNYKLNNNTLVLGGSGSGKTRGYVMPNVLQAHSSYIITDPKGEILEKAGHYLSVVKGYRIRVLNLDNKALSDCYNPFAYVHPEREGYEERVMSLIETIIINTDGGEKKGSSDPFWDRAEKLFLQAIFFFVSDGFVESERNMGTVLKLIGMLRIEEEKDDLNSDLDIFAQMFAQRFGGDHIGVQQYNEFRSKASGRTAKSIVITAVARLASFRTREVQRIFSADTMELERVGEEKTAIFVVVPPTDSTFNFVAGMLFTQLFQELQYCATEVHRHEGQRLPVPCRFILDEFANTCQIPNFVQILAYARSFGIGITVILQSLEQIKKLYKDDWGVIVDNCNTLLFLGSITHMDTLEYISKLLGKGTYDKRTTGHSKGRSGSSSENFDVIGRELMTADEIRKIPKEECLLIVGGRPPFYSEKYAYESHPSYRYTSDGNPAYSFYYTPAPLPEMPEEAEGKKEAGKAASAAPVAAFSPVARALSDEEGLQYLSEHYADLSMAALAGGTPADLEEVAEAYARSLENEEKAAAKAGGMHARSYAEIKESVAGLMDNEEALGFIAEHFEKMSALAGSSALMTPEEEREIKAEMDAVLGRVSDAPSREAESELEKAAKEYATPLSDDEGLKRLTEHGDGAGPLEVPDDGGIAIDDDDGEPAFFEEDADIADAIKKIDASALPGGSENGYVEEDGGYGEE